MDGEFRGLHKDASAVEVATALHEQFNCLDSLTGLPIADQEISRKGFETTGIKESVLLGWNMLSNAKEQYAEILEPEVTGCLRSGLSTAKSLQLYVSKFDKDNLLTTSDRIFMKAYNHQSSKIYRPLHPGNNAIQSTSSFVDKASGLGFVVTPHAQSVARILPPLYHTNKEQCVSAEFEQINEDMFSRKENKFMVFNGAGVDSWSGTLSITKTFHPPMLDDAVP
jgi:hypothetical protein